MFVSFRPIFALLAGTKLPTWGMAAAPLESGRSAASGSAGQLAAPVTQRLSTQAKSSGQSVSSAQGRAQLSIDGA